MKNQNSNQRNPNQDLDLDQNRNQENLDQFESLEIRIKTKLLPPTTIKTICWMADKLLKLQKRSLMESHYALMNRNNFLKDFQLHLRIHQFIKIWFLANQKSTHTCNKVITSTHNLVKKPLKRIVWTDHPIWKVKWVDFQINQLLQVFEKKWVLKNHVDLTCQKINNHKSQVLNHIKRIR